MGDKQTKFTFNIYLSGQLLASVSINAYSKREAEADVREMFTISEKAEVPHFNLEQL
jgi:hypothetical protein